MVKGAIFDFNGTLFFDSPKHVLAWKRMSQELRGQGISVEEMQSHFYGVPIEECLIFEDSDSGIRDAYAVGCRNIIVVDSMGVAQKHEGKPGIIKIVKDFIGLDKEIIK